MGHLGKAGIQSLFKNFFFFLNAIPRVHTATSERGEPPIKLKGVLYNNNTILILKQMYWIHHPLHAYSVKHNTVFL